MGGGRLRAAVVYGGSTACQSIDRAFYEVNVKICCVYLSCISIQLLSLTFTVTIQDISVYFSARNSIFFLFAIFVIAFV